ncbi:MAG: tetratricopeptide repeat protein [Reichenbachiella sp.]|uniref:tetratricopeptide repeat protein n=1 Tax=Reichenbachiella sp. TaxID=2184521 RepID=UPI00326463A3
MKKLLFLSYGVYLFCISCTDKQQETNTTRELDSLISLSSELINLTYYDSASSLLKKAQTKKRVVDSLAMAKAYFNRGLAEYHLQNWDSSGTYFEYSGLTFSDLKKNMDAAQSYKMAAVNYRKKGLQQQAIVNFQRALDLAELDKNESLQADIHNSLGLLYEDLKEYSKSLESFQTALDYYARSDDGKSRANLINNMGIVHFKSGSYTFSKKYYQESLALKMSLGDSSTWSSTLLNIGELYLTIEELDSAEQYLRQALDLLTSYPKRLHKISSFNLLGELHRKLKNFDSSKRYLTKAKDLLKESQSRKHLIENHTYFKKLYIDVSNYKEALRVDFRLDSLRQIYFEEERLLVKELENQHFRNNEIGKREMLEQDRRAQERIAELRLWLIFALLIALAIVIVFMVQLSSKNKKIAGLYSLLEIKKERVTILSRNNFHFAMNAMSELQGRFVYLEQYFKKSDRELLDNIGNTFGAIIKLFHHLLNNYSEEDAENQRDIKPFLDEIILDTLSTRNIRMSSCETHIESMLFRPDDIFSIAQIINELLINTLKHSQLENISDIGIKISLTKEQDWAVLEYADNGVGIDKDELAGKVSFGINMIHMLAKSLRSEFEILESESGTHFRIKIPYKLDL